MDSRVRLDLEGSIGWLRLDRPGKHNALDLAMWQQIADLVAEARAQPQVRVLLLASATPGLFCAGGDIAEMVAMRQDPRWVDAHQQAQRAAQLALAQCPLPVIALIDGAAIGGGCGLALACDIRIASPRARFAVTPAKLGIAYPRHDTRLLVDAVGAAQARRLLFTAMTIDATEALRIGLVDECTDGELEAHGRALAVQIAGNSAFSVGVCKQDIQHILEGAHDDDPDSMARFRSAFEREEFAMRSAAFVERAR